MTFTQTQIIDLVQNFTGRTVAGNPIPVSYGPNEIYPFSEIAQGTEVETGQALFGTLELVYTRNENGYNGINFTARGEAQNENSETIRVDKTTLSVNRENNNTGFRSYQNVLFDKINGLINEDFEIHFSGYLITFNPLP